MHSTARTLRLILGDQLNPLHSWFDTCDAQVVYVLMEVRSETDYVLHHAQKVLAIFAAMRDFADRLRAAGHRVRYIGLDDPSNRQSLVENLGALVAHYQAQSVQWQAPDEWRVDAALRQWAQEWAAPRSLQTSECDSEHFLTSRDALPALFGQRKQWLMEHFYRQMRQRFDILLDAQGKPAGGQWNYDHDNRKRWPGQPAEPQDWRGQHDHSALWDMVQACGVRTFGQPDAAQLRWPLNREEALQHLEQFIATALPCFGDYEDAMSSRAQRLFHSLLSCALNLKMLHPLEVARRAEQAWLEGQAPLAAVEGFVRQIIGWREYVRGIYWSQMPGYDQRNVLGHDLPLPAWFWTGQTQMRCLHLCITQSLQTAHAHHIQRLMVIGNFALLAGLHPRELHHWYLGIYIDAFEWVELPNTLGMSQWADGGIIATKPYVSSAAYIGRMSDYCQGCAYDPKQKTGEKACPYNALYWDFFLRHQARLGNNPRLGMVYQQLKKMNEQDRAGLQERATDLRSRLDQL